MAFHHKMRGERYMVSNYMDLENKIEQFSRITYKSECMSREKKQKNMLMISHTLERGGAPLVLLELVPFFKQEYNIIFI